MYKIYINETLIQLCDTKELSKKKSKNPLDIKTRYTGKKKMLLNHINAAEQSRKFNNVIIHTPDLKTMWTDFKSLFIHEVAAGGLVFNPKEKILLIFRRNNWDLPKGKLEKKESNRKAAVREVMEETGIKSVKITKDFSNTYHIFTNKSKKKRVLKETVWYLMRTPKQNLTPQLEEDITAAKWKNLENFLVSGPITYRNISDLLWSYYKSIDKKKAKIKRKKKGKASGKNQKKDNVKTKIANKTKPKTSSKAASKSIPKVKKVEDKKTKNLCKLKSPSKGKKEPKKSKKK